MASFTLRVEEIRIETKDAVTIVFKQPGIKKIRYLPGQYISLIFRINGRKYVRPYSFSSAPDIDKYLEITVKRVPGGIVSNHIADKVNVGDVIEALPPMGDFIYNENLCAGKNVILWGAGSGITPLMSIAKYILQKKDNFLTLVYGNRNFEQAIFINQLNELQEIYKERFTVLHFHTQSFISEGATHIIEGRIEPSKVLSIINTDELKNTVHYICGPTGLKLSVKTMLEKFNIDSDLILSEDFELTKDFEELKDIITRDVLINKNGENYPVEVVKGKSILDAGLDSFIDLDYSCQNGTCTLCKGTLLKGEVKVVGIKKMPGELLKDEYLLCCCYPLSDNVLIKV